MPINRAIFVGFIAVMVSLTAPALARHSDAMKSGEQPTPSPCSARQRMADGTWAQAPCQELGTPSQTSRKSATQSSERQTR